MTLLDKTRSPSVRRWLHKSDDNRMWETERSMRCPLQDIDGLTWKSDYRGAFRFGTRTARVLIEPREQVTIAWHARARRVDGPALLKGTQALGGNARFILQGQTAGLQADTRFDGHAHLPATMQAIRQSFTVGAALLRGKQAPRAASPSEHAALDFEVVERALEELGKDGPAVVRQQSEWELRVPAGGVTRPVRVRLVGDEVVLSARLVGDVAQLSDVQHVAVADYMLRLNARVRGCRLQQDGMSLTAETRLNHLQLDPTWLTLAARAVAVAANTAGDCVRVLVSQPNVAATYRRALGL